MKRKLFLLGLLSFFYVNSQVLTIVDFSAPNLGLKSVLNAIFEKKEAVNMDAVPENDNCDTATPLTVNDDDSCTVVKAGTLAEATDSGVEGETGTADDDVWFSFVATANAHKISLLNIEGTGIEDDEDLVIELLNGTCDTQEIIGSSDPESYIATNLEEGSTYYIRVFSYFSDEVETTFDICVGLLAAAPVNDDCENAVTLTVNEDYLCGTVTAGTLVSATDSGIGAETGTADDDVWFSFTATNDSHKIELLNVEASDWDGLDLVIEVFEGECGGVSIDDSDPESVILTGLIPETVYYVRVYSYYTSVVDTTFDICIGTPPNAPENDECSGAQIVTVNLTSTCTALTPGTLQSATNSGIEAETGEADDDVWYQFVASSTSQLISLKNIEGNVSDLVFEVLEGACDEQSIFHSSDDELGLVSGLAAGTTYYLRVFTYGDENDADTTFDVCIATPDPAPVNDECDGALPLFNNPDYNCGTVVSGTLVSATDSGIPTENGYANDDVWFSFTASSTTQKISLMNIQGNNTDLVIEVFEGECGGLIIESSDPEAVEISDLIEGEDYFVRVFSYTNSLTHTTFTICLGAQPLSQPNDECDAPTSLTVNENGECTIVTTASLAAATDSGIEADSGNANDDVWFSFVALGPSQKVTLTSIENFEDLMVEVFSGTCETLTLISDDESPYIEGLETGATYYVRVFSYGSEPVNTTFSICVALRQPSPINDECEGAIAITVDAAFCNGVLNNGSNLGATESDIETPECISSTVNDVWFSFVVPENVATVNISTDFGGNTIEDSTLALYSGTCGDLNEMKCNDDAGNFTMSAITNAAVTVGQTYYVRVSGYSFDNEGSFCLDISTNQVLSTEDFSKNTLKAYPNPVKNILNLSNTTAITDVAIFNLLGQQVIVKSVNANEGQIDMSHLSAGAYLVKVTADNGVQTIKIIKE